MNVLSPLATVGAGVRSLARRPGSLGGRRLGVLDNSKPNADVLLSRVAGLAAEQVGAASVRGWRKPGSARAAAMLDEIAAAADVVITASAD